MRVNEKVSEWKGFECREFVLDGRACKLIIPQKADEKKRWLMKTVYFGAYPGFEIEMLKRGYHLAYIDNKTRWALPSDIKAKEILCDYLVREYGLNEKCVPVGMSCGGLQAVYFAAEYPHRVAALYLDAPVMNLLSCPAAIGNSKSPFIEEFTEATGMTVSDLINYRNHPIDKKEILVENKIPVIMIWGDRDEVVPYEENGKLLEDFYREKGGEIVVIGKKDCGHHPHGLEDPTPIVDFVEKRYV